MKVKDVTKEQVQEATKGATSISDVARKLGLCKGKLDGKTSKHLRGLVPELDDILKSNKEKSPTVSTEPTPFGSGNISPNEKPVEENPYRPGSVYAVIYDIGSKGFQTKQDIIAKASALTGKSPKCISFSLTVLTNKKHSSNGGRSTVLLEDGKMKLIALRRN